MKVRYLCLSALAALAFSAGAAAQQAPLCATEVARLQNSLDSDVNMKEEIEKQEREMERLQAEIEKAEREVKDLNKKMAAADGVDYLGALPLNRSIREQADSGRPTVVADPDSEVAGIYRTVARQIAIKIAQQAKDFSSKFPTITISKDT